MARERQESYDEPQGVTVLDLGDGKTIQVELSTFNEVRRLGVRQWLQLRDGGWVRTRNGLSVPANKTRPLIRALNGWLADRR